MKGFTLIELLVVVLIIGILSSVALPQYTKAVEKARMTEAVLAVESIARANKLYYMANGNYTRDINDLDIDYSLPDSLYFSHTPAKVGKFFVYAASNESGNQHSIAMVSRRKNDSDTSGASSYSLRISLNGAKYCNFYSKVSEYQKKLCLEWSGGNFSDYSNNN